MPKLTEKMAKRGREVARAAYHKVEKEILAAEGRRSLKSKAAKVTKVGKQAAKAALVVGGLAAAAVVARAARKGTRA